MEWAEPKKSSTGRTWTQESKDPAGYHVTCVLTDTGSAVYVASRGSDPGFARFEVPDPKNRAMMLAAARSMRAACGLHKDALESRSPRRR